MRFLKFYVVCVPCFDLSYLEQERKIHTILGILIYCVRVPLVRKSSFGKSSFMFAAPVLWNSFPDFRKRINFNQFKGCLLLGHLGFKCRFLCFGISVVSFDNQELSRHRNTFFLLSHHL